MEPLTIGNTMLHFFDMIVHLHIFLGLHYHHLQHQLSQSGGHYRHALREFRYWANVLYRKMT